MKVYQFLYNDSCWESAARTMSLHKTLKGAEMALSFHKEKARKQYNEDNKDHPSEYEFGFDEWWGIRELELQE